MLIILTYYYSIAMVSSESVNIIDNISITLLRTLMHSSLVVEIYTIVYCYYIFLICFCSFQDGLAATKALREAGFKNLIIGVTGNMMDEDMQTFLCAGADTVLGKPLRYQTIKELKIFTEENGFLSRADEGFVLVQGDTGRFQWESVL